MEWRFKSTGEIDPSTLQAQIVALLRAHGAPDSDFDAAELICGELIGNLVRHGQGAATVRLDWAAEHPTLSVCDADRYVAPVIGLPSDPFAESGRGLFIIKALAKDFTLTDAGSSGSAACATLPVKRPTQR